MTRNNFILLAAGAAVTLGVVIFFSLRANRSLTLPHAIHSYKEGLVFANQVKDRIAPDARLTLVMVDLDDDCRQPTAVTFGYASKTPRPRIIAVTLDNATLKGFCALDTPELPANALARYNAMREVDLSGNILEIADCLSVAETNNLAEFRRVTPAGTRQVDLVLDSSETNTTWSVQGDAWDKKGPIADVGLVMDARTGAVIRRTSQKAANRSTP